MRKIIIILLFFVSFTVFSQDYFRITADFVVKIKKANGMKNLTKGRVYYDKNIKELIYDIDFPEREKWILKDTMLYKLKNNKIKENIKIPQINEFTIFHLALNVSLNDFGLEGSPYKMMKVEKKNGLVLSYWKIPNQAVENVDHIIIAKNNNKLVSVVMIAGDKKRIINKQFFKDYQTIGGFQFPKRVIQISYDKENRANYQVFSFKNIVVNDLINEKKYHYSNL